MQRSNSQKLIAKLPVGIHFNTYELGIMSYELVV